MASNITVYTMEFCPFCTRAKALLTRRGLPFKEILVPMDDEAQWDALEKKTGMKTMPMIFHGEKLIGGYNELADLDHVDQLNSLK